MKLNNYPYRTVALLLLVLLAASCTNEDDFAALPDEGTANVAPLTITVTDGAYAPAQSPDDDNTPDTRAVERGYATEFTKGDRIGLYVVEKEDASNPENTNREFLHENLCLTHDGTGWTLPAETELTHRPPEGGEILYFAYYPYQSDMTNKVDIDARDGNSKRRVTTEARWFFRPLINMWDPKRFQDTYEAYTASDLMVARGEVAKRTYGTDGSVLSFTIEHQMVLMVIRVPTTKYIYTETIGGVTTEKSYRLYNKMEQLGLKPNNYTERFLVNPNFPYTSTFNHHYYNSSLKKCEFIVNTNSLKGVPGGRYHLFTIDDGEETVTERHLREGDFYMKDGTIIPHENVKDDMPADVQEDCLGVVFWAGENEGQHWTLPGDWKGDHLLMRDHPGCVHGLVVALHDASSGAAWAEGPGASEALYQWAVGFSGFNSEEQADWLAIWGSSFDQYGYCSSHIVKLYSAHHPDATFPAYNTISTYAARHPAPGSSSGWFFPAWSELAMMCYGKAKNYDVTNSKERRDLLNGLFQKAGGEKLVGRYWSTLNYEYTGWFLDFDGETGYGFKPKSDTYKVRAVLAF